MVALVQEETSRAIPLSVCCPQFLSGAYFGNGMPYLDDIWYVSEFGPKVCMLNFGHGKC